MSNLNSFDQAVTNLIDRDFRYKELLSTSFDQTVVAQRRELEILLVQLR